MIIRQEQEKDYSAVFTLIESSFKHLQESDHKEQFLVERLRKSDAFIPELSLVAENEEKIIGYILLSKVEIISNDKKIITLALAPIAVLPEYQRKGIGKALIAEAHKRAILSGYTSIVLLGHKDYYPQFGYRKASEFGIIFPFNVPDEYCMAIELLPDSLKDTHGIVHYSSVFFE